MKEAAKIHKLSVRPKQALPERRAVFCNTGSMVEKYFSKKK